MRVSYFSLIVLAGMLAASPALAGKVSYTDGRGQWVSTGCTAPQAPDAISKNSEAKADDMNSRVAAHNAFVVASQEYMACVSREAQHDAEAFGQLITNSAQEIINKTQQDVTASAARVHAKSAQ